MNELGWRLGLQDSYFVNVHGLDAAQQHTSAYDLAVLSRYAMTLPEFRKVVATARYVARGSREITVTNVNAYLRNPGADGIKTGYTEDAGPTLVASASADGHRIFTVLLDDPQRDADAVKLLQWTRASYRW